MQVYVYVLVIEPKIMHKNSFLDSAKMEINGTHKGPTLIILQGGGVVRWLAFANLSRL